MRWLRFPFVLVALVLLAIPSLHTEAAPNQIHPAADPTNGTKTFTGTVTVGETLGITGILGRVPYSSDSIVRLPDGRALITGGTKDQRTCNYLTSVVYDPKTRTSKNVPMQYPRAYHTSTVLFDGRVLLSSGSVSNECGQDVPPPEIFDPRTDTFRVVTDTTGLPAAATVLDYGQLVVVRDQRIQSRDPLTDTTYVSGTLAYTHTSYQLVALADKRVLLADFSMSTPSEVYDPATGTVTVVGTLQSGGSAVLLDDGRVLFINANGATEYFDPRTGAFTLGTPTNAIEGYPAAVKTLDGDVMIVGSREVRLYDPSSATYKVLYTFRNRNYFALPLIAGEMLVKELGSSDLALNAIHVNPGNTFNGSLVVPDPWINRNPFKVRLTVESTRTPLQSYAVTVDNGSPSNWQPVVAGQPITATVQVAGSRANMPVSVYVRDANGQEGKVVSGTVNVDTILPSSSLNALPAYSQATFPLSWTYSDSVSGVASVAVEVREGTDGVWRRVIDGTKATSTTFSGTNGVLYQFRIRATDVAGNIQPWPTSGPYVQTTVDTQPPSGTLTINKGARATTGIRVLLEPRASDATSPVVRMRIATDGTFGAWQQYTTSIYISLAKPDGIKDVAVQFRDAAGNESETVTQTIRLDTTVDQNPSVSINDGAYYTKDATVALRIGAPVYTAAVQISNDGTFRGPWLPYDTTIPWVLDPRGQYTIARQVFVRLRDTSGKVSTAFDDSIIYDPEPPTGSVTITAVTDTTITVQVSARDEVSQESELRMRLGTDPQFSGAAWQPYVTTATLPRGEGEVKVYAQFEDGAGNQSGISCGDQSGGSCGVRGAVNVFLPLVRR